MRVHRPAGHECSSQHKEVAWTRSPNGREGDCPVKGDEAPAVMRRQAEQIDVGDLLGTMDARVVKDRFVEDGYFAAPIFMVRGRRRHVEQPDGPARRHRTRITRLRQDTDAAVQCCGAGCPAMLDFLLEPSPALLVVYVIAIKKGQEEANVQQRTHEEVSPD